MPLSWMMLRKQGALTNVETWLLFDPPIKIPGYVPVHNRPNKPDYDVTFAPRVCAVSRWLPANKYVVFDYLNDPGCAEFHVIRFFIALKYCLSTVV